LAAEAVKASDCLIAFGAGLNRYTTGVGELTRGKKIVQIDTDPLNIGLFTQVDVAVIGDAATTARAIAEALGTSRLMPGRWGQQYAERLAAWKPTDEFEDASGNGTVDARSAIVRLDELLPFERNVVTDVGRFVMAAWRFMSVPHPSRFTHTSTFGSIGLGLAAGIGAAIADPHRLTIAIMGDGGFMMSVGELSTAVRNRVPLLAVVLNDGAYGAEYNKLKNYGEDPSYSLIAWPDLAGLAAAMGARSRTVSSLQDLEEIPELIADIEGPVLVDVRLDPKLNIGHW
jgi:thiamine pyrophosphate-dependent acetolactate synthase large subunit-like protein